MKLAFIVLDGAPDGERSPRSTLEEAHKPNIDSLAGRCLSGLMYPVAKGVAPESDVAVMSILGYDPEKYYTGRGPLEALGAGVEPQGIALRANFATIRRETLEILDRRVGRSLTSREARELAKAVDGMALGGGRAVATFRATIGHRGVIVIRHLLERLSAEITNTDPAYERVGFMSVALKRFENRVAPARPLREEARLAAELVNEFTMRAIEILESHEINAERERRGLPKANAILLRDAGDRLPPAEPMAEKYGLRFASIAEMPVEVGIARVLGMKVLPVSVENLSREELLQEEARLSATALEELDAVYVHLKGPDEPGHDGDLEGKIRAVEAIDKHFFSPLLNRIDIEEVAVLVTSDHQTPWDLKAHGDGAVPVMISHPSLPDNIVSFSERSAGRGSLGIIEKGYMLMPKVAEILKRLPT